LQFALLVAGVVLLAGLVRTIGLDQVVADLRGVGWGFAVVIGLELILDACNTLGWRRTFPARCPVGLVRLFWIRLAGTAINQLTPTATVGGEFVKAMFLRPYLRTPETVACLIAARMSYAIGQATLVLVGLAALLGRLEGAPELTLAILAGFAVTLGGVLGFIALQRRGMFAPLATHGARLGLRPAAAARLRDGSAALDHHLGNLYRERPLAFAASVGWHFVGQLVGLLQLWCILSWLDAPAPLMTCLAIEAFAVIADSAMFFVPGRVGVQEGGRVLVFTALGMSAATGLAAALIVRLAQLASAALGLAAYAGLTLDRRGADR
jgi:uncharacterized membrane protein YbhN (UPF0104 family)